MKLKMIFNFTVMNNQSLTPRPHRARDSRCLCGNLLARLRPEGVELKCRRCKRVMVIPWGDPTTWHGITIQWQQAPQEEGV
jgi:phage FluMu protein Com